MGVIKNLKNKITGVMIYPVTKTKAVYDDSGTRLDILLQSTISEDNTSSGATPDVQRDADTIGGLYNADYIKAMNDQISNIGTNMQSLGESVGDGKALVANAITSKGVVTATDASFETMASNIGGLSNQHFANLGSGTSFNVASVCSKYASLTSANFVVMPANGGKDMWDVQQTYPNDIVSGGAEVSKNLSYNAATGVLSSSYTLTAKVNKANVGAIKSESTTLSVNAYVFWTE